MTAHQRKTVQGHDEVAFQVDEYLARMRGLGSAEDALYSVRAISYHFLAAYSQHLTLLDLSFVCGHAIHDAHCGWSWTPPAVMRHMRKGHCIAGCHLRGSQ